MIAKCKAIAHGNNALEYVFREGKLGRVLALHNLCGETPKEIHEEMKLIGDYNSRCKNKFLRIEIGIAPLDEPRVTFKALNRLVLLFAKQMGLTDHQWVAVTHKDTDDLHIHIIANRISLGGRVYDTTFVSNRAARVAEELSHKYGLTIANEVRSARLHRKAQADPERERTKLQVRNICYALLDKHRGKRSVGPLHVPLRTPPKWLHDRAHEEPARQSLRTEVYLRRPQFQGLRSRSRVCLLHPAETVRARQCAKAHHPLRLYLREIHERLCTYRTSRRLCCRRSGRLPCEGGRIQAHGADYAEIAWQRRLRNEAGKKKKRGRGI